jgi:type IV secretory pathway VirB10-like protein
VSEEASATAKADPETLVLRGAPGRVVRFRRGAVIAIAALGSTAIVGAAWVALKPATFRMVAGSDDRGDGSSKAPADALADAPKSYGDVPQLGAPLPGDLGRPILEHQRSIGASMPPAGPDQAAQAAEAERQRLAAERKAARESGVIVQVSGANRPTAVASSEASSAPTTAPCTRSRARSEWPAAQGRLPGWKGRGGGHQSARAFAGGVAMDIKRRQRDRGQSHYRAQFRSARVGDGTGD